MASETGSPPSGVLGSPTCAFRLRNLKSSGDPSRRTVHLVHDRFDVVRANYSFGDDTVATIVPESECR